jgi:hypothetical protein
LKIEFSIELHDRDFVLVKKIQEFFECGNIYKNNNREAAKFVVTSLNELSNKIIPHFLSYPLLTQKAADFILFKQIVELMKNKEHLNSEEGLLKIINLRASMNKGLSDLQKSEFKKYNPVPRPIINSTEILDPH